LKSIRLRAAALSPFGFVLVAGLASAEPSSAQKAMASQFFDDAEKLMASGKAADACPKYAESQRLDPQLGTLLHLADCYEKAGMTASAWTMFKDAVEIATQRNDPRASKAKAKVADLEGKLPRLVVTLAGKAPSGIEVRQDGEVIGGAALGSPVPVDPGKHNITAKAAGFKAWSTAVDVPPGASSTRVAVPELQAEPAAQVAPQPVPMAPAPTATPPTAQVPTALAPPPAVAPPPAEAAAPDSGSTQRTIGYAVGAAGVVGIGLGTFFGLTMRSKLSDRDAVCGPAYLCTRNDQVEQITQLTNDARSAGTSSWISFAVGGAALVGGIAIMLTAPSNESKTTSAIDLRPWIGPNNAGATVVSRW
jgi:hypothetical protein